jgi:hypothetical protein
MKDKVAMVFGALAPFFYSIPAFLTLVYLLYEDLPETSSFFGAVIVFGCDVFLSTIWPIYWGLLRWIF